MPTVNLGASCGVLTGAPLPPPDYIGPYYATQASGATNALAVDSTGVVHKFAYTAGTATTITINDCALSFRWDANIPISGLPAMSPPLAQGDSRLRYVNSTSFPPTRTTPRIIAYFVTDTSIRILTTGVDGLLNTDVFNLSQSAFTITQPAVPRASGGTVTITSDGYSIHTFTTNGTFTVSSAGTVRVQMLLVAGGGGGGGTNDRTAGGGGAGGCRYIAYIDIPPGSYNVTVGTGGAGGTPGLNGSNGGDTDFGNGFTSYVSGGGGGAGANFANAGRGGSGGGVAHGAGTAGSGFSGEGFGGGPSSYNSGTIPGIFTGSGGGGAGGVGGNGTVSGGGAGGIGLASDITGTMTYYAGGGGGSAQYIQTGAISGGAGGSRGGGAGAVTTGTNGSTPYVNGGDATFYGGGGGGSAGNLSGPSSRGGNGYGGVVIIKYPN